MKIWHKIMVAPGLGIVFLMMLGAISYSVLTQQNSTLAELFNNRFANYQISSGSAQDISEVHSNVYRLFTWLGNLKEDKIKQITDEQKAKIDAVTQNMTQFAARSDIDANERKVAEAIVKKLGNYKSDVNKAIDLSQVDFNIGMSAMQNADSDFQIMIKDFDDLVKLEQQLAQESYEGARSAFGKAVVAMIAILVLALGISAGISLFMSRIIVRQIGGELDYAAEIARKIAAGDLFTEVAINPGDTHSMMFAMKNMQDNLRAIVVNEVGRVLEALSRGDLTEKISNDYPGAFGQLKDDANSTVEKLKEIIAQVKDSTGMITIAAQEIAEGNSDLSQRTEEQAASLEETASSMEELTSTVKQNADNAKQANQLSMSASDIAVKGGQVVGDVVQTMASISASSKKIVDIISVIEGIAFQTNILALNAAVEAARAGEQGRGFAVVAGEVRNLAQRSASAAKEIKTLIGDSVDKVDTGSRQADQAGATMSEIVTAVKRVTDIMAEIAAASNEQSAGIEQVNQAVIQMDTVTQQNAALVQEASAAAEAMQEQATALDTAMNTFKLEERREATAVARHVAQPHKALAAPRKERKLAKTKPDKDEDWKEF